MVANVGVALSAAQTPADSQNPKAFIARAHAADALPVIDAYKQGQMDGGILHVYSEPTAGDYGPWTAKRNRWVVISNHRR